MQRCPRLKHPLFRSIDYCDAIAASSAAPTARARAHCPLRHRGRCSLWSFVGVVSVGCFGLCSTLGVSVRFIEQLEQQKAKGAASFIPGMNFAPCVARRNVWTMCLYISGRKGFHSYFFFLLFTSQLEVR